MAATRVLLCVTAGIAAYKAPELVRRFVARGFEVRVVLTPAAHHFVSELALATVSRSAVRTQLFDVGEEATIGHIDLADWADVVVVAPATADVLARAAAGMANDLATTCLLATRAPVVWAPAMNTNMWNHPATRANLAVLRGRANHFVGPDRGELACGWVGEGKMIDPDLIVAAVAEIVVEHANRPWAGRRVLVTAGPTRTYLDLVRFLTNGSTGAMGFAVAEIAASWGAEVTLVAGPVARATPSGVHRIDVETADEMLAAVDGVLHRTPQHLVAMVAAVADLRATWQPTEKLPKDGFIERLQAPGGLERGVDVLQTLASKYRSSTFFLGFGAQTVDSELAKDIRLSLIAAGTQKLGDKNCHAIFVNRVGAPDTGIATATNAGVLLFAREGPPQVVESGEPIPKLELARWLLAEIDRAPEFRRLAGKGFHG